MKTPPEARDGPAVPRAPRTRAQAHLPAQAGERHRDGQADENGRNVRKPAPKGTKRPIRMITARACGDGRERAR